MITIHISDGRRSFLLHIASKEYYIILTNKQKKNIYNRRKILPQFDINSIWWVWTEKDAQMGTRIVLFKMERKTLTSFT